MDGRNSEHFDLVVVGAGPAGEKGAAQAAYHGKRVAVVEAQAVPGGTAVRAGAIPTKTLRETSLYVSGYRGRDIYGVSLELAREHAFHHLEARSAEVVRKMADTVAHNLERHGIELVQGWARLVGGRRVHVDDGVAGRLLEADVILLTPGSRPRHPAGIPFDDPDVFDSDEVVHLDRPFDTIVILGGGAIGCEYASIFAALDIEVTVFEPSGRLVPFADGEISAVLARSFEDAGIRVVAEPGNARVERRADGLVVTLPSGAELVPDKVLFAAGRVGNVEGLGLAEAGVELDEHNRIVVDEHFRTTVEGIYAAGDVVGPPALGSVSMEQARVAICHAFSIPLKRAVDGLPPAAVYSIPEVGMVGMTEEGAAARGIDYEVGRAWFENNTRATIAGQRDGLLKLVFAREDLRLLGTHIVGDDAAELVHIGQAVIHHGGTLADFIDTTFNVPTRSDAYKYAAYDGLGNVERARGADTPAVLSRDGGRPR